MASQQIHEFLSHCPSPESDCFAGDPDALDAMLNFGGDSGIRTDLQRASVAATEAAKTGIALEDATYAPVKIEVASTHPFKTSTGPYGETIPQETHRLGDGEPRKIIEDIREDDEIGQLKQRIAKCAYACGATAVGCPLRTPTSESASSGTAQSQ